MIFLVCYAINYALTFEALQLSTCSSLNPIQRFPCHHQLARSQYDQGIQVSYRANRKSFDVASAQITMRNLLVVRIDGENNLLLVRGAVPGPNGGYVIIRETNKVG